MNQDKFSYRRRFDFQTGFLLVMFLIIILALPRSDVAFSQQQSGYNTAFITDEELINTSAMSEEEIRSFLENHSSYFREQVPDVDGQMFDPAQVIAAAAQQYQINPQVILATLQKENGGVTSPDRPSDTTLRSLMGCQTPSTARAQIQCAAERFRAYHNAQLSGGMTVSGWRVGITKQTQDGVMVTPATMAVAGQFTYTPYVGRGWGGSDGGVHLFCELWHSFGFGSAGCGGQAVVPTPTADPAPLSCTVALDPGHGGPDPGAQRNGINEKDIVWTVANSTRALLTQQGYQIVLTRAEDTNPSFGDRWQVAYQANAAFLVSIHANASTDVNAHGTEAWYQGANLNPHADSSQQLAQFLTDSVSNRVGLTNRGTKIGKALYSRQMPSALIELAFISNETERNLMVNNPDLFASAVAEAIISFAASRCNLVPPPPGSSATSTVLVFDTSGSMEGTKLSGAKQAGNNILDIIAAENQAIAGTASQASLVDFNNFAKTDIPLVTDMARVRASLNNLAADGSTAMPDGLSLAIGALDADTQVGAKRIIILLSDGMANVGLGGMQLDYAIVREQVLGLAADAAAKGYCIYTVGFGDGSEIDEDLLRETARLSGCGDYYNAQNVTDLANVYVTLRHTSTGAIQLEQSGAIAQGEEIEIGRLTIPQGQALLLYTLNWPGSMLQPILFDPRGRLVDMDYPGASLTTESSIATIIINDPAAGDWQIGASGVDVPQGTTTYNAVVSTRAATAIPRSGSNAFFWVMLLGLTVFAGFTWQRRQLGSVWYLQVTPAGQTPYQVKIGRQGVWVGRSSACQVRLQEPAISRHHCWIGPYEDGTRLIVRDDGSALGTKRNGQKIRQGGFGETDVVEVGQTKLRVSRYR